MISKKENLEFRALFAIGAWCCFAVARGTLSLNFSRLRHACWLLTYPLVGWLGATAGLPVAFLAMGAIGIVGAALAWHLWPGNDAEALAHTHTDLDPHHPHIAGAERTETGYRHVHTYIIDAEHAVWPAG